MEIIYTKTGSKGNCTIVKNGSILFMIDCGIPLDEVNKAIGYKLTDVNCCLITHAHSDHSKYISKVLERGITCYMSKETQETLKLSSCMIDNIENFKNQHVMVVDGKGFSHICFKPFDLPHSNADGTPCKNFGYLIKSKLDGEQLMLATDCHYNNYVFPPCEYYMVECNYEQIDDYKPIIENINFHVEKRRFKSHMSLEKCKDFLSKQDLSKCKTIYLIHISDKTHDGERFKKEIEKLTGKEVIV